MLAVLALLAVQKAPVFRTSTVDVTPPELLPLGGYTARGDKAMEAGGEPLYCRTLVFENGESLIAIVSLEALTIPESLYSAVKDRVPPDVRLFLTATHTHCAPDSQMLNERMTFKVPGIASFSRRWLDWYATKIADGVRSALIADAHDVRKIGIATAAVDANRGRRAHARPDKTATYLIVDGKPILTGYAAHATVYDEKRMTTSGDWPGAYAKASGGLVLPGAIGDASPVLSRAEAEESLNDLVSKLRAGLSSARVERLTNNGSTQTFLEERIALDKPVPHPEFSASFGAPAPLDHVLVNRFAPTDANVTLAVIGSLLLVGIPGEPTSEVGDRVKFLAARHRFPRVLVVSHTNGWIGYVLTPEDYDRGGYEATLSFHGRETSERVIEAVERGLKKIAQAAPRVAHTRKPTSNTAFRRD